MLDFKVGDVIGWKPLPYGDELEVIKLQGSHVVARRGFAETFVFDEFTDPPPYLIRPAEDFYAE